MIARLKSTTQVIKRDALFKKFEAIRPACAEVVYAKIVQGNRSKFASMEAQGAQPSAPETQFSSLLETQEGEGFPLFIQVKLTREMDLCELKPWMDFRKDLLECVDQNTITKVDFRGEM